MFFGNKFMAEPHARLSSKQKYWTEKVNIGDLFFTIFNGLFYSDIFTIHIWVLGGKNYIEIILYFKPLI